MTLVACDNFLLAQLPMLSMNHWRAFYPRSIGQGCTAGSAALIRKVYKYVFASKTVCAKWDPTRNTGTAGASKRFIWELWPFGSIAHSIAIAKHWPTLARISALALAESCAVTSNPTSHGHLGHVGTLSRWTNNARRMPTEFKPTASRQRYRRENMRGYLQLQRIVATEAWLHARKCRIARVAADSALVMRT